MRLLNKATFFLLFITAWAIQASAQMENSTFTLTRIPVSSHINALGGTNITILDAGVASAYENPALLGAESRNELALNYMNYLAGIQQAGVSYGLPNVGRGYGAVGIQYLDFGKFIQATPDGTQVGSFSAKDIAITLTYSHDFNDQLRGGITTKLFYSIYEQYSAFAMGVDLGLNYYNPEILLSASLVAKDLGGELKAFSDERIVMPWELLLGLSKELEHAPFRFSLTARYLNRWSLPYHSIHSTGENNGDIIYKENFAENLFRHLILGVDYIASPNFYISLGYNYKMRGDMQGFNRNFLSGFSTGLGFKIKDFKIEASIAQHHVSATSIMINLSTNFNQLLK